MVNNQFYRGARFAGIVGHTVIDPTGPLCLCGRRGCWELLGSGLAIKDIRIEETIEQANRGDADSIETLSRIGEYLGVGIANLILTLHPELVILGGRMSKANHWVLNPCMRVLKTSLPKKILEATSIELSELYPYVSALGGVALVLNNQIWHDAS